MRGGPFWLDISRPDSRDVRFLEDVFGIHPLTAEDIITADTREKVEIYDGYLFLCMRGLGRNIDAMSILEGDQCVDCSFDRVCYRSAMKNRSLILPWSSGASRSYAGS